MRIKIYPYKQGSASARLLADNLQGKVLKRVNSVFVPRTTDVVVNWGSSIFPDFSPALCLNRDVSKAQSKLECLKMLYQNGVSCPDFWIDRLDIPDDAFPVVCRKTLTGHSGHGIVLSDSKEELVDAPLYTRYIKKKDEYRVHVLRDNSFFIQRKARKLGVENPDYRIRNLGNGFVFINPELDTVPDMVVEEAVKAIQACQVDFGGVDVIWNEQRSKAYVLEINTACGLEPRTAEKYSNAIKEMLSQ